MPSPLYGDIERTAIANALKAAGDVQDDTTAAAIEDIEGFAALYLSNASAEAMTPGQSRDSIKKIIAAGKKLLATLGQADTDSIRFHSARFMGDLQRLIDAAEEATADPARKGADRHRDYFLLTLAAVFEECTGKDATITTNLDGTCGGLFFDFLWSCYTPLPEPIKQVSKGAIGKAMRDAIDRSKDKQAQK
jgi:hypothetical protein